MMDNDAYIEVALRSIGILDMAGEAMGSLPPRRCAWVLFDQTDGAMEPEPLNSCQPFFAQLCPLR